MNPHLDVKYWFRVVNMVAEASTCRAKVGCVLVYQKQIVGTGYVGSVHGDLHCEEAGCLIVKSARRGQKGDTCIRTVHAELNAVLKCTVRGRRYDWIEAYCTHQPCLDCLKAMLQIGVRYIWYQHEYEDKWRDQYLNRYFQRFYGDDEFMMRSWREISGDVDRKTANQRKTSPRRKTV